MGVKQEEIMNAVSMDMNGVQCRMEVFRLHGDTRPRMRIISSENEVLWPPENNTPSGPVGLKTARSAPNVVPWIGVRTIRKSSR